MVAGLGVWLLYRHLREVPDNRFDLLFGSALLMVGVGMLSFILLHGTNRLLDRSKPRTPHIEIIQ